MERFRAFIKKEAVLCIAAAVALATMALVPPDGQYPGYIDLRVLCLLFSLMAVVNGFQRCGVFRWLAYQLLKAGGSGRSLGIILVLLPFFSSMLVTNDVALLVFVPFTVPLLYQIGCGSALIPTLVLQTVAANLGSMATPVGNPQNLFLYANYSLSAGDFFGAVLPLTGVSLVALTAVAAFLLPKQLPALRLEREQLHQPCKLAVCGVLFALCLLTVFRVLPYWLVTAAVAALLLWQDRDAVKSVDYSLLLTFVCFFILSGNLGRVEPVRQFLQALLQKNALLTTAAASQVISNVPAAVLLSGFTDNWKALLQGANIGGLGTPIASLASLITLKLYLRQPGAKPGKFLAVFSAVNFLGLALLLVLCLL